MQRSALEAVLGAFVLAVAIIFLVFAYGSAKVAPGDGAGQSRYTAFFNQIDGIQVGSDVRMAGVKVGQVADMVLDRETYLAKVTLAVDGGIKLPGETQLSVASEGLLGGKYLSLQRGWDEENPIAPNGEIERTVPSASLEQLLGQVIYSLQDSGKKKDEDEAATPAAAPASAPAPGTPSAPAPAPGP